MSSYRIDQRRWEGLSFLEQMGNIGIEVDRAISARRAADIERADGALDRAVDLIDATVCCLVEQRSHRLRELLLARNEFLRIFFEDASDTDVEDVDRYFMYFAVAAQCQRRARRRGAPATAS
ncbi:hypothetical protein Corgl_1595 [Coriobacterium glomerans PW2]|uniref:Uncharacterized protein n=1 Tax=Coriobacterium glomerans (strain ATCC 49209 / DSM 20642 / JCM 10262 / PW2) TaxID=700015 RepID=F2N918_CORGP|nr:hypothetical protein [Coriobacterium glomerans]AEB07694.1 hypothetical protein Corgl_1595 [Coriobacterium glomerans PW2]